MAQDERQGFDTGGDLPFMLRFSNIPKFFSVIAVGSQLATNYHWERYRCEEL